jgi:hypothetical protein
MARAWVTACSVWSGGIWKTPNPRIGIWTPLFRVTKRIELFVSFCSKETQDRLGVGGPVITWIARASHLGRRRI